MPQFKVRPNTYDASIFDYVCRQNEYELADLSGKRILDIGGHIGSFAVKAVAHGAEQVVSFEPDDGNYELLEFNIGPFENASCEHLAISRSDKDVEVRFDKSDDAVNSGGGCSVTDFGEVVPSMSLDAFTLVQSLIKLTQLWENFTMALERAGWECLCLRKIRLNFLQTLKDV